ncbi:MAG: DUF192 domain-containing protein [Chloroflexi bacterium]|nr:DUF192 domain-containing protein [Chloroflexota bacterium]
MAAGEGRRPTSPDAVLKVRNLRTQQWLTEDLWVAASFWAKLVGLLGQSGLAPSAGLYIAPCQSIHSFFMRFPFDAVFVDGGWRVLHLTEAMPPFRISPYIWRAKGVLELPVGAIHSSGTQKGDTLELVREQG